jgi:hypothetical protein
MISFDLKCTHGHVFEAWFRSSAAYDEQNEAGMIGCPMCGSSDISKALMAPAVAAKSNRRRVDSAEQPVVPVAANMPNEEQMRAMISALAEAQTRMLKQSQWVGDKFAQQARAMHYGDAEQAAIHGTTDPAEARAMMEEGVPLAPLIVPIAPPDALN